MYCRVLFKMRSHFAKYANLFLNCFGLLSLSVQKCELEYVNQLQKSVEDRDTPFYGSSFDHNIHPELDIPYFHLCWTTFRYQEDTYMIAAFKKAFVIHKSSKLVGFIVFVWVDWVVHGCQHRDHLVPLSALPPGNGPVARAQTVPTPSCDPICKSPTPSGSSRPVKDLEIIYGHVVPWSVEVMYLGKPIES